MHRLHPGAQVLHKHVTNLAGVSPSDGIVVLDLGPRRSRTGVGSGQPPSSETRIFDVGM